ncbi:MAG: hypothetical protein ACI4VH_02180 [Clostridia bacterium]
MKKKILIIFGIILAVVIVLYIPIPIGEDIHVYSKLTTSARSLDAGKTFIPEGNWTPDNYIITKEGIIYKSNSSFEKEKFIKYLNLLEKINIQFNKSNEEFICKLLNINKTTNTIVRIF